MSISIKLNEPVDMPTITYVRLCAIKVEIPRPGKESYMDIWLAKCVEDATGSLVEPEGITGINIILTNDEVIELFQTISPEGIFGDKLIQSILQFLVAKGYVQGEVGAWTD